MAFIILLIVIALVLSSVGDYATVAQDQRKGHEMFQKMQDDIMQRNIQISKEQDVYYNPAMKAIKMAPDYDFYRDGSLKRDSVTGKYYPKGKYMCNSYGRTADSTIPRPPKELWPPAK